MRKSTINHDYKNEWNKNRWAKFVSGRFFGSKNMQSTFKKGCSNAFNYVTYIM